MGDLKPIGSEKLTGQEKLKRIMEIARFNENIPTSNKDIETNEYSITLADGNNYQIVKEKLGYIIKKTISESDTDYIEPMKNRKYYSSYSQAFKRLNLLAGELNRLNENSEGISFFGEQKKFVLKTPKPELPVEDETPAPPPAEPPAVPAPELPASPNAELPSEPMGDEQPALDLDVDATEKGPEGDEQLDMSAEVEPTVGDDEMVTFKTIQKLTGKLTQKIRVLDAKEGMTSEDIKYVINMVLSSLDLKNLSAEDKEDVMEKFEEAESREEGGEDMSDDSLKMDDLGDEDITSDSEVEKVQSDLDVPKESEMEEGHGSILDSIFAESKVDKVLSKYFEVTKKEILENREKNIQKQKIQEINLRRQMKEINKISESTKQRIVSEKFLKENPSFTVLGKTNKQNLVFENKEKQIKITPEGEIL